MTRVLPALFLMAALCLTFATGCEEKPTAPAADTGPASRSLNKEGRLAASRAAEDGAEDDGDSADEADEPDDADTEEVDEEEAQAAAPPKCPVSDDEADSDISTRYKDVTYYFCCDDCREAFLKNPEKFAKK